MKSVVTAIAAAVFALTGGPAAVAKAAPAEFTSPGRDVPASVAAAPGAPIPPPLPQATDEPSASPSAEPSASPTPSDRRPVDEEGERWVNLAVIAGIGLIGTVLAFMIAGGVMRHRSRRREG